MSDAAPPEAAPSLSRALGLVALATGTSATLLGLMTTVGWLAHVPGLVQLRSSDAPMVFGTGLCFVLAGLGILARGAGRTTVSRGCGASIAGLVALTLAAYLTDPGLGIDRLLAPAGARPVRMAPNTAVAFLLVGLALALPGQRRRSSRALVGGGAAGIAALSLSTVALVGYAFGIVPAFAWGPTVAMSPQTALGLCLVGVGLVAVVGRPDLMTGLHRQRWLALLAGAAGATTSLLLWQALAADHERTLQERVDVEALSVRNAVSLGVELHEKAIARLAHRWEHRTAPVREEWEADAGSFISDFPAHLGIAWADPQGRVRWIVPLAGHEKAIGADLMAVARRRVAIEEARRSQRATIFGPAELLLGGRGFGVLAPLTTQGGVGGFMSAGFRGERFLDSVLSSESRSSYRVSLLLAGEPLALAAPEAELSSDLRSRSTWFLLGQPWSVEVVPTLSWESRQHSGLPLGGLCGGLLLSGILAWSVLKTGEARLTVLAQQRSERALREAHLTLEGAHLAAAEQARALSLINDELHREIGERRTAEHERDKFFSLSVDMLCISNRDGYFKRLNPAFELTLGYTVEELTARPFLDFVHPDDLAATLLEVERQVSQGSRSMHFENRYRCRDGSYRWLAWKSAPDVESGMMYAVARDVTKEKRLLSELQASLTEVRTLSEMLPMCSSCRRIRDVEDGSWSQLEHYLSKTKSGTQVSHDMCPECMGRLYPDHVRRLEARKSGEKT